MSPLLSDTMAQEPTDLQIAILGAGMGGLTCALALAQRGFKNIDVYENAHDLGFVGAGIQLAPNMARVLDQLGVWKGIEAEAVNIGDTSVRSMCPWLLSRHDSVGVHVLITASSRRRRY